MFFATQIHGMALVRVRRLYTCSVRWAIWRFWRRPQTVVQPDTEQISPPPPEPTPAEHLKQLTLTHMPQYADNWTAAPLHTDLHVKAKILLSCETEFKRSFPSTILGSLSTVGDVLKVLENTPASSPPPSLFPDIDKKNLPPNLSIQMGIAPKKVQKRVPFQNYSKPEYAEFPNKKLKDARAKRGNRYR